jgi:hypothetical protein
VLPRGGKSFILENKNAESKRWGGLKGIRETDRAASAAIFERANSR